MVFQGWLHESRSPRFIASHLSYASRTRHQRQTTVKVPGSFRPTAGRPHLHSHCNFAESLVETAPKSLRHSCRSELRVIPLFPAAQTMPSSQQQFVESPRIAPVIDLSCDIHRRLAPKSSVVTGSCLAEAEDFPRHYPQLLLELGGLRRYERD